MRLSIIIRYNVSSNEFVILISFKFEMDDKPQVKSGWGAGGGAVGDSAIGMAKKSNAAAYWDNRITELIIPEMEAEIAEAEEV